MQRFSKGISYTPFSELVPDALTAVVRCLSKARLNKYLLRCGSDEARAVRLYEWNTDLSAALYDTIQCFDVIIRNAICVALEANEKGGIPWYESHALVGYYADLRIEVEKVKKKATDNRNGFAPNRHDIVAATTLSLWRELSKTDYFPVVWKNGFAAAFSEHPKKQTPKAALVDLHRAIDETLKLRNRIAHHEPILGQIHRVPGSELQKKFDLMVGAVGWVDVHAQQWVLARSAFGTVLAANPDPQAFKP